MAEDPIWSFSKGSSISFKLANSRTASELRISTGSDGLTVSSNLVHGSTEAGKRSEYIGIDLPRVGLSRDRVGIRETEKLGDSLVQRFDLNMSLNPRVISSRTHLVVVTVEKSQK